MRPFLLRFHLITGLLVGLVLLVMGGTGILLSIQPKVLAYLGRNLTTVSTPATEAEREEKRWTLDALAEPAAEALGRAPNSVTVRNDPAAAVAFGLGQERTLWLDPYTGVVLGESAKGPQNFFKTVEGLHRWFALEGKNRAVARKVVLVATVGYLLLLISGLFMWDRRFLKDRSGPRRWHKQFGFILSPLILVSAATGLILAINALVTPEGPGRGMQGMRGNGGGEHHEEGEKPPTDFDALLAACVAKDPAWKQVSLRLPRGRGPQVVNAMIEEDRFWIPQAMSRLALPLDPALEVPAKWESYDDLGAWQKTYTFARAVHKGLYGFGGWLGMVITLLVGIATVTLVVTGFILAWKRLFGRSAKTS